MASVRAAQSHEIETDVLKPYDTTEPTTAGAELTVVARDDPSGWTWLRNSAGREGWVPNRTIEPLPGD